LNHSKKLHVESKPDGFARAALTLFTGSGVALAVPLLLSPLLSRIYAPAAFGQAAVYLGIASAISLVATGRYEFAVLIPKRDAHAMQIAFLSLALLLATSILSGAGLAALGSVVKISTIYYTIPFAILFVGLASVLERYNNRRKSYALMSLQRLVRSAVDGAVAIVLGTFFQIDAGLIVGSVSGYSVAGLMTLYLTYLTYRHTREQPVPLSRGRVVVLAKKYASFPKYNMPHALVNGLSASFPVFILPFFFPEFVVGLYAFSLRVVQAPLSLLSFSIASVLAQEIAEAHAHQKSIKHILRKRIVNVALVSLLLLPFSVFAKELFGLLFGPDWAPAGKYIQILTPFLMLNFVSAAFSLVPPIFDRQRAAFAFELVFAVVKALGIIVGGVMGSIETSLALFSIGASAVILLYLKWLYRVVACYELAQTQR